MIVRTNDWSAVCPVCDFKEDDSTNSDVKTELLETDGPGDKDPSGNDEWMKFVRFEGLRQVSPSGTGAHDITEAHSDKDIYTTQMLQRIEENKAQIIQLRVSGDNDAADKLMNETTALQNELSFIMNGASSQPSGVQAGGTGGYVYDAPSFGYAILGFFIPIVGLILYLMWKDQTPQRARSAGKGALTSVIVGVALSIILVIIYAIWIANMY